MSAHAFLPPSGAADWKACTMWPTMNALYPESGDKQAADEGSACHWAGAELHYGRPVDVGARAPNGVLIDDELLDVAEVFAASLHSDDPAPWNIEQRIIAPRAIHEQNWGTPDAWRLRGNVLQLRDWKAGYGYVSEFENWQLINYAALIITELGLDDQAIIVEMTIVQPRCYGASGPIRTWTVRACDLRAHWNILRMAAEKAVTAPEATTGPQCEHCPGRAACPELQRVAGHIADRSATVLPLNMPPHAVGLELRNLRRARDVLDARITGLEEQALGMMRAGQQVPFWSVQHGQGRERWTVPGEQVAALGMMLGQQLTKVVPITPAQARAKGVDEATVAAMSERPAGAAKLVPDDGTQARKVFGL